MSKTKEQLLDTVTAFLNEHHAWLADRNRSGTDINQLPPDDQYWDIFDHMAEKFRTAPEMPEEIEHLRDRIVELQAIADYGGDLYRFFVRRDKLEDEMNALGYQSPKKEEEEKSKAKCDKPLPYLPSIFHLSYMESVPHEQIARMYRLTYDNGIGRTDLVLREIVEPGSVIGPDWVDPRKVEFGMATSEEIVAIARQKEKYNRQPATTAENLFFSGAVMHFAAKLLDLAPDEIDKLWRELKMKYGQQLRERMLKEEIDVPDIVAYAERIGLDAKGDHEKTDSRKTPWGNLDNLPRELRAKLEAVT